MVIARNAAVTLGTPEHTATRGILQRDALKAFTRHRRQTIKLREAFVHGVDAAGAALEQRGKDHQLERDVKHLQVEWPFYVWDEATGEVRWMCSWDTTEDDVQQFAAALERAAAVVPGAA